MTKQWNDCYLHKYEQPLAPCLLTSILINQCLCCVQLLIKLVSSNLLSFKLSNIPFWHWNKTVYHPLDTLGNVCNVCLHLALYSLSFWAIFPFPLCLPNAKSCKCCRRELLLGRATSLFKLHSLIGQLLLSQISSLADIWAPFPCDL